MDKVAKKLKQKRRAEREKELNAIRQEQEKELLKRFEVVAKRRNDIHYNACGVVFTYQIRLQLYPNSTIH